MELFDLPSNVKELESKFKNEDTKNNRVTQNALSKCKLSDLAFVSEAAIDTQFVFNTEIKSLPVCNQRQSGRCWLFAGLNVLREKIAKELNLKSFELSQNYLSFYDKLEKCNYTMNVLIQMKDRDLNDRELMHVLSAPVIDGGQWDMFVSLVKKYGVVPSTCHYETAQSNGTMESNKLLSAAIRQFAADIHNKSDKEVKVTYQDYMSKIFNLCVRLFGLPQESFEYVYKKDEESKDGENVVSLGRLTPIEFAQKFKLFELLDQYQSVVNAPQKSKDYNKTYTVKYLGNVVGGKEVNHLNVSMERLEDLIITQLKDNEVVWFGSDVGNYRNRELCLWDNNMYDYKSLTSLDFAMDKGESLDYRESAMSHAMVLTGVHLDSNNHPIRWKIENSWGGDSVNKGYYVMSEDFFKLYTYQAVILKKYLNETETKALKQKPVELDPWDPLGALAN